ncbi:PEP-utilizing enzyme [Maridesulfovibrio sp.]|uniref:PEP-utilizing enzyme n=1 Tax=Maridesulfovibrio sp. TaxID=2795000 RepID=UPI003BAAFFE4
MNLEFGTKAETLEILKRTGFNVPDLYYFSIEEWLDDPELVLAAVLKRFSEHDKIIVRSSSQAEDGSAISHAGAFESILNVNIKRPKELRQAISTVASSFKGDKNDQILIQPMIGMIEVSGVIMSRCLEDGSPYYVINYDDESGKTDSITGGTGVSKTVFIYKGVSRHDFDSSRLRKMVDLVYDLEKAFPDTPLDIEFGLDSNGIMHLFQVRRICTTQNWKRNVENIVSQKISFVESFVNNYMKRRSGIQGERTILGVMPDWNPAEIIGVTPKPLAASLYREIVTRKVWSQAREVMGYRRMPPEELMVLIAGRPYIDVRNSFNSFLPAGLPAELEEKLINAWIERLDENPHFHDKVEFEIAFTVHTPDFEKLFHKRYPDLLTTEEFKIFREALLDLTNKNLAMKSSLDKALDDIEELRQRQEKYQFFSEDMESFDVLSMIKELVADCCEYGTLPFSIIARHGFIAESFFRSLVAESAISAERISDFKKSVETVSGQMSSDYRQVCLGQKNEQFFLERYGHLRPGTYDILSPRYADRENLFAGASVPNESEHADRFELTESEEKAINRVLKESDLMNLEAHDFFDYAGKAIAGREYAKFVFTKNLSDALEGLALWGKLNDLTREQISLLNFGDIMETLYSQLGNKVQKHFHYLAKKGQMQCELASSFKLSYLIRSARDVYIVPQHRCTPNFVTAKSVEAPIVKIDTHCSENINLEGFIVCIESADPGYDWVFTRNIAGLITKYGGTNSHMAIRCAEYGLPAAIGCGEMLYEKISGSLRCTLDACQKTITPENSGSGLN